MANPLNPLESAAATLGLRTPLLPQPGEPAPAGHLAATALQQLAYPGGPYGPPVTVPQTFAAGAPDPDADGEGEDYDAKTGEPRKKPPVAPKRREQNRLAQAAFRERRKQNFAVLQTRINELEAELLVARLDAEALFSALADGAHDRDAVLARLRAVRLAVFRDAGYRDEDVPPFEVPQRGQTAKDASTGKPASQASPPPAPAARGPRKRAAPSADPEPPPLPQQQQQQQQQQTGHLPYADPYPNVYPPPPAMMLNPYTTVAAGWQGAPPWNSPYGPMMGQAATAQQLQQLQQIQAVHQAAQLQQAQIQLEQQAGGGYGGALAQQAGQQAAEPAPQDGPQTRRRRR